MHKMKTFLLIRILAKANQPCPNLGVSETIRCIAFVLKDNFIFKLGDFFIFKRNDTPRILIILPRFVFIMFIKKKRNPEIRRVKIKCYRGSNRNFLIS